MKFVQWFSMTVLCCLLLACGHGFEGEYKVETGSSNAFLNAFANAQVEQTLIIGSDYLESDGERKEFDDIFVEKLMEQNILFLRIKNLKKHGRLLTTTL